VKICPGKLNNETPRNALHLPFARPLCIRTLLQNNSLMKKKKRNPVHFGPGTSGEKMGDETPDFVCRGCGYHAKNCVCSIQKTVEDKSKVFVLCALHCSVQSSPLVF